MRGRILYLGELWKLNHVNDEQLLISTFGRRILRRKSNSISNLGMSLLDNVSGLTETQTRGIENMEFVNSITFKEEILISRITFE